MSPAATERTARAVIRRDNRLLLARQHTKTWWFLPGQCEVRGEEIGGIAVHIGARVSTLAGPTDVLVSSTLRDLVIGSGLEFEERGTHELKGVPGEWHLFAVASP